MASGTRRPLFTELQREAADVLEKRLAEGVPAGSVGLELIAALKAAGLEVFRPPRSALEAIINDPQIRRSLQ